MWPGSFLLLRNHVRTYSMAKNRARGAADRANERGEVDGNNAACFEAECSSAIAIMNDHRFLFFIMVFFTPIVFFTCVSFGLDCLFIRVF